MTLTSRHSPAGLTRKLNAGSLPFPGLPIFVAIGPEHILWSIAGDRRCAYTGAPDNTEVHHGISEQGHQEWSRRQGGRRGEARGLEAGEPTQGQGTAAEGEQQRPQAVTAPSTLWPLLRRLRPEEELLVPVRRGAARAADTLVADRGHIDQAARAPANEGSRTLRTLYIDIAGRQQRGRADGAGQFDSAVGGADRPARLQGAVADGIARDGPQRPRRSPGHLGQRGDHLGVGDDERVSESCDGTCHIDACHIDACHAGPSHAGRSEQAGRARGPEIAVRLQRDRQPVRPWIRRDTRSEQHRQRRRHQR